MNGNHSPQFIQLKNEILNQIERYYDSISRKYPDDIFGTRILYPQIAYFANCEDGFAFELGGAGPRKRLSVANIRAKSIVEFLDPCFSGEKQGTPIFEFEGDNHFQGFSVFYKNCEKELDKLFPNHREYFGAKVIDQESGCPAMDLKEGASRITIENTLVCNSIGQSTRYRHILLLALFRKSDTLDDIFLRFQKSFEIDTPGGRRSAPPHGVFICSSENQDVLSAIQMRSLVIRRGVKERTIGDFINLHPEIIYKFFDTDKFSYEESLKWIEHDGTITDKYIRPDLFVRRADGKYDIVDFKLARLDKPVTGGKRRRRGFNSYVSNGIQQLANYAEYFNYEGNADYAMKRFGISVNTPNLYLIVGSRETVDEAEVRQAMRQYEGTRLKIVDFDTLISGLLVSARDKQA